MTRQLDPSEYLGYRDVYQVNCKLAMSNIYILSTIVIRKWEYKPNYYKATIEIDDKDTPRNFIHLDNYEYKENMRKSYTNVYLTESKGFFSFQYDHGIMENLKVLPYYKGPGMSLEYIIEINFYINKAT